MSRLSTCPFPGTGVSASLISCLCVWMLYLGKTPNSLFVGEGMPRQVLPIKG